MENGNFWGYFKSSKKKLGITISGVFKQMKEICRRAMDNNDNREVSMSCDSLVEQVEIVREYLKLTWKSKKRSCFKHPSVDQLKFGLSFNNLFFEGNFYEVLRFMEVREEIIKHMGNNGIERIYEKAIYIFLKNTRSFYDFLTFKWSQIASPRLIEIWEDYRMIRNEKIF